MSTYGHLSNHVKVMVFPVVLYGCESWTIKKAEHRRSCCCCVSLLSTVSLFTFNSHFSELLIPKLLSLETHFKCLLLFKLWAFKPKVHIQDCKSALFLSCSFSLYFVAAVVHLLSHVWLFATPRTAACQASLYFTISQSLLRLMSIDAIQPFHSMSPPSPFAINLFQHQGLFQ